MKKVQLPMKRIRLESNLSKEQFAKVLKVSIDTVNKWETGELQPDSKTLCLLEMLIESIQKNSIII